MTARQPLPRRAIPLILFALNAWLCFPLFLLNYSARVESAEASFISISRYLIDNWRDLSWFPLWYNGIPFHQTYPPLLHAIVALTAVALRITPAHAHHSVTAFFYCLGPVSLYLLTLRSTNSLSKAAWTGLAYSLLSPTALFIPWVRAEIGSPLRPWRICTLVLNGDGPHIAALALMPLALLALDSLVRKPRWSAFVWTVLALGAIALTNWIGAFALAASVLLYLISRKRGWLRTAAAAVTAYLLVCPWIPPSAIAPIPANSALLENDARAVAAATPLHLALLLLIVIAVKLFLEWRKVPQVLQFAVLWFLAFNAIPIFAEWLHFQFILQPHRYTLELDLTFCFLAVLLIHEALARLPRPLTTAAFVIAAICVIIQIHTFKIFMTALIQPIRMEDTIEFRTAEWLQSHIGTGRVFATGSISFWLNAFTDVPQLGGGADQGLPDEQIRTAFRTIYGHPDYPRNPDGSLALMWLQAYGVDMAVVGGPHSLEYFKLFHGPTKFDRIATKIWQQGDDAIYSIPRRSRSLAHILPQEALDVFGYVAALENPAIPAASFTWNNRHSATVHGNFESGQLLSLQISYHPGWRATVNGEARRLYPDNLGQIVVEPRCSGPCAVELRFRLSPEAVALRIASLFTLLCLVGVSLFFLIVRGRSNGKSRANTFAS